MKKISLSLAMLLWIFFGNISYGQAEERYNFYNRYNPTATIVYSKTGDTATGDQVAVNAYTKKTIQISGITVGENVRIKIEGRSKNQKNTPNWAVLDVVDFNAASADSSRNRAIDVDEHVDFLRVGIQQAGGVAGISYVDVEGIFVNLEK